MTADELPKGGESPSVSRGSLRASVKRPDGARPTSSSLALGGSPSRQQRKSQQGASKRDSVEAPITIERESSLRLLQLGFPGCGDLTDAGVTALANALPASLSVVRLELSSCLRITDHGIKPLVKKLQQLPDRPQLMCNLENTGASDGQLCFRSLFDVEVWQMGHMSDESPKRGSRRSLGRQESTASLGRHSSKASLKKSQSRSSLVEHLPDGLSPTSASPQKRKRPRGESIFDAPS